MKLAFMSGITLYGWTGFLVSVFFGISAGVVFNWLVERPVMKLRWERFGMSLGAKKAFQA